MDKQFEGKVALVTGGASGVGRATALLFAKKGAKVVIADVDVKGGEKTEQMVKEQGGEAMFVKTDVSRAAEVEALVKKIVEKYGRLDCASNNAAVEDEMGPLADCTEENFDRSIRINLKSVWACMKYEIQQMLKQGGGTIVNIGSVAALIGIQRQSSYNAAKAGVLSLSRTAALEYIKSGIRINAVCPGGVNTPINVRLGIISATGETLIPTSAPIGRRAEPEELAEAVVWMCSDSASYVVGHTMIVDGGVTAQ